MSYGKCGQCKQPPPTCRCAVSFSVPTQQSIKSSLIDSLTPVVDQLRDLYTCFGARQYIVSLVWERWSGGERGVGYSEVAHSEKILPTPLVKSLNALSNAFENIGLAEAGGIRVSEISPRYTEDFLMGRSRIVPEGDRIPDDVNFYWQLELVESGVKRRFNPRSVPSGTTALDFDWSIDLVRAQDDAERGFPA